jgi:single-strand DNA-binding protein
MNTVNLIGWFIKEGELKYLKSGKAMYVNTLAVKRKYKKDETDLINLVAFEKTAELMGNNLKKGDQIGINGRIQTGSYEKDGRKIYTFGVVVDGITFVGKKEENKPHSNTAVHNEPVSNTTIIDESDLPF